MNRRNYPSPALYFSPLRIRPICTPAHEGRPGMRAVGRSVGWSVVAQISQAIQVHRFIYFGDARSKQWAAPLVSFVCIPSSVVWAGYWIYCVRYFSSTSRNLPRGVFCF